MDNKEAFLDAIKSGYTFKGETIKIGAGMLNGEVIPEAEIFLPLSTLNRHGLIAGATGGGKTKSFQMIAEGAERRQCTYFIAGYKRRPERYCRTGRNK